MSRSPRQRRIAAAAATRRWRRSQTKGIQLVTVEVSEVRLAQLVAERLVPAAAIEDFVRTRRRAQSDHHRGSRNMWQP